MSRTLEERRAQTAKARAENARKVRERQLSEMVEFLRARGYFVREPGYRCPCGSSACFSSTITFGEKQ